MATLWDRLLSHMVFYVCLVFIKGECPKHWSTFKASCYKVVQIKSNWIDAKESCEIFDSYIAEITSHEENDFVKNYVKTATDWKQTNLVWFGLSSVVTFPKWIWSMSSTNVNFTDWWPGQPNGGQKCVGFRNDLAWHDDDCSANGFYLCERGPAIDVIG